MPSVRVRENEYFDAALRRFKRACEKAGVLTELRRREFYEKPTQERKRKKAAAVKRHMKRVTRDGSGGGRAPPGPRPTEVIRRADPLAFRRATSMSSLKDRITEDMKAAMRAKESERLGTIRMITSAIKQREVDERIALDDTQVLSVIEKMIKMRKESIAQFKSGGRDDLAAKEQKEIELLQAYLPAQLAEAEVDALIAEAIAAVRRHLDQGNGQGHGAAQAESAGPHRHGRRQRQAEGQAHRLTLGSRPWLVHARTLARQEPGPSNRPFMPDSCLPMPARDDCGVFFPYSLRRLPHVSGRIPTTFHRRADRPRRHRRADRQPRAAEESRQGISRPAARSTARRRRRSRSFPTSSSITASAAASTAPRSAS